MGKSLSTFLGATYQVAQEKLSIFHLCGAQAIITEFKTGRMDIAHFCSCKDSNFCTELSMLPCIFSNKKILKDFTTLPTTEVQGSEHNNATDTYYNPDVQVSHELVLLEPRHH